MSDQYTEQLDQMRQYMRDANLHPAAAPYCNASQNSPTRWRLKAVTFLPERGSRMAYLKTDLQDTLQAEIERLERQQKLVSDLMQVASRLRDEGKRFNKLIGKHFEKAVPDVQVSYAMRYGDYISINFVPVRANADLEYPGSWIPRGASDDEKWARLCESLTTFQENTERALTRARDELNCLEKLIAADQEIGELYAQIHRIRYEAESLFGADPEMIGRRWSMAASEHLHNLTERQAV